MTTLTELKTKADDLGIDRGIVRLYGDLRKIETWEKAVTAYNTVTVEAETIIDEVEEIIPFTHEVVEAIADCPPPPPIVRPCPTPEIPQTIPGIEIAETSPPPGHGRGDERFRNLGDRLGEKIKLDIFKFFDSISAWIWEQFANFNRLTQYDYFDTWYQIDKFQAIHKTEKIKIYEFIEEAIVLVTEIKQNHIPWYLQQDMPAPPPVWCETKQDNYYLLLEKPTPIPTLSIDYDGQFIPNCFHELGVDIYCFLFPNQLRAEEYFEQITEAKHYQFIPASQPQPQLLLAGV